MYKTQINHKAMHGGYKQKPSKQSVNALMDMYSECFGKDSKVVDNQLKLELCTNARQPR
jgi:hypothetical protein